MCHADSTEVFFLAARALSTSIRIRKAPGAVLALGGWEGSAAGQPYPHLTLLHLQLHLMCLV